VLGQTPCTSTYASILGSTIEDESGYSLALSNDKQFLYAGGLKSDSAIILKLNLTGKIIWTRSFDVVPNKKDFIYRILVDSDGMLGVSGIAGSQTSGGSIFTFRYDPDANKILWSKELTGNSLNFNLGMIELGPGGNYLVSNNPSSPNVAELVELDRTNGSLISGFSKQYDLGSSETFFDMEYYKGDLYVVGRFSDGGTISEMRNTLAKMNPTNGNIIWSKLGHLSASQTARLYGTDIIIARDTLYSIYLGDDNGNSVDNTQVFVQKTTLDGKLIWIKQYEFPGPNDWVDEIVHSNNGLVILGRNRVSPSDIILFKIDYAGKVAWGKRYDFTNNDNSVFLSGIQSQLIESSGKLFFTAVADNAQDDMILVQTDLNGEVGDVCTSVIPLVIPVKTISNPNFYARAFTVFNYMPQIKSLSSPPAKATSLQVRNVCILSGEVFSAVDTTICEGRNYLGHTQTGQYIDTLQTISGCDSIQTLNLVILPNARKMESKTICTGDNYMGYFNDGIYLDTFMSVSGCDSIRTLQLTTIPTQRTNEMKSICKGSSYLGYSADGI
jgi:outer membrane protein assembly factor BamB